MKSDFGRRQFLSRAALFGAAALVLRPASAFTASSALAGDDQAIRTALEFVQRYSPGAVLAKAADASAVTRIDAPVSDLSAMASALSRAGRDRISRVEAHGNVARFAIGGRAIEVHHEFSAA